MGCVNPRHLSWKTPEENQADAVRHGRYSGLKNKRRKLTDEQVAEIRSLRGRKNRAEMSKMFGVRTETIDRIWAGKARTGAPAKYGRTFDPQTRAKMVEQAKIMRGLGATFESIGRAIGVTRVTAGHMARD